MSVDIKNILEEFTLRKAKAYDRTDPSGLKLAQALYVVLVEMGVGLGGVLGDSDAQESVLDRFDPTAALPANPSDGDRYIATATAKGWTDKYIYTWLNGSGEWSEVIPNEGAALWVEDENLTYVFNGTAWQTMESLISAVLVPIADADGYYTTDNVEAALKQIFEKADVNSTHVAGDGSDHADVAANTVKTAMLTREIAAAGGKIELLEGTDNGVNKVTLQSPALLTVDRTITVPDADVALADIATNSAHVAGDGSGHADVAANTVKTAMLTREIAAAGGKIELLEGTDNGVNKVTLQSPALLTVDRTITVPDADVALADIATNSAHVAGDGSGHADVAANTLLTTEFNDTILDAVATLGAATAGNPAAVDVQLQAANGASLVGKGPFVFNIVYDVGAYGGAPPAGGISSAATTGSVLADLGAQVVCKTNADGHFVGTTTFATGGQTVYIHAESGSKVDALSAGCLVRACVADAGIIT